MEGYHMQRSLNTGLVCSSVGWLNSSDLFFGIYSKFLLRKVVACYGIDSHNLSIYRLVFHCVCHFPSYVLSYNKDIYSYS